MKYRPIEDAGLWRSYEAGRVITRSGQSSPLLRMPMSVDVKQLGDKNSRVLRFIASTEDEDRDGDIIRVAGWDLTNFLTNPAHLWAHNMREDLPPIGKSIRIEIQDARMINDVDFFMAEEFELARLAFKAHLAGVCAESVGFRPLEAAERHGSDGRLMGFEFKRQELLEISSVPVPSNPNALMMATQKGLLTSDEATTIEKVWMPQRITPIEIYLPQAKGSEAEPAASPAEQAPQADAEDPRDEHIRVAQLEAAKALAQTLDEPGRKLMQQHCLLMAEAYGLKITIETGEAREDEATQVEALAQTIQALSQRWEQREQHIGRAVSQAVEDAVKAL